MSSSNKCLLGGKSGLCLRRLSVSRTLLQDFVCIWDDWLHVRSAVGVGTLSFNIGQGPVCERWAKALSVLHILAVDPSYQRQGLGSLLIRPGLEAADKAGAQTYIEASPSGLPLYLKHGWEPVDEMVIDMRQYGGHQVEHQKFLMREPNAPNKLGKKKE